MAQDTTVPKLNFKYWLDKAIEWGQATTLESQKDVCLHLPQLQEFLHQTYETLKHMNSVVAIQQFPLIGQLLGRLCWNPVVIGYDESQKTLMWCLCCLYSSEPQNPVELKANSWIRTVSSLVTELRGNQFNELSLQGRISDSRVNAVSLFCLPLITLPDLTPLLETLLVYHGGASKEILSLEFLEAVSDAFLKISDSRVNAVSLFCLPLITLPDLTPLLETLLVYHGGASKEILSLEFLEAVSDAFLKKKISLSESAVFSLWHRHLPSLESATLHLLDQLISLQITSLEKVAGVIKDSLLPQAASHPAIFRIVNEIFKNALLETDGTPEVMTIIRVFMQLFVQVQQNENKQVSQDLILNVSLQSEDTKFCKKISILLIRMVTE
ncbi:hypothetical protein ASZ78_006410 [Callipepla squamata]|uniref:Fanconi anemia group C protein homolog n=1 Tax=Callipepla squamata TaxID=9009 RepID=A0A226MSF6_CALSU|nr:hypothetical protein ASZ78_006410 [Callipepla squamata]